jgi:hypothetical protein
MTKEESAELSVGIGADDAVAALFDKPWVSLNRCERIETIVRRHDIIKQSHALPPLSASASNAATLICSAAAILATFRSDTFRSPRSTSPMYVRWKPASAASCS